MWEWNWTDRCRTEMWKWVADFLFSLFFMLLLFDFLFTVIRFLLSYWLVVGWCFGRNHDAIGCIDAILSSFHEQDWILLPFTDGVKEACVMLCLWMYYAAGHELTFLVHHDEWGKLCWIGKLINELSGLQNSRFVLVFGLYMLCVCWKYQACLSEGNNSASSMKWIP